MRRYKKKRRTEERDRNIRAAVHGSKEKVETVERRKRNKADKEERNRN